MSSQSETTATTLAEDSAPVARPASKGPKITPSERARLAAQRRRTAARGGKSAIGTPLYLVLVASLVAVWGTFFYRSVQAPPPSPIGEVTAPRIQLKDGRFVAYHEAGASAATAKYHVLVLHGWGTSRLALLPNITQAELEELSVRLVSYDRPGYGQSDPFPQRTFQSEAEDIAELSEQLNMGKTFYVIGISMGGYPAWACLRYIPHKLNNVGLVGPVHNFFAKSMQTDETTDAWMHFVNPDRYAILIARHMPGLLHFWMKQNLIGRAFWGFGNVTASFSEADLEILSWPEVEEGFSSGMKESLRQGRVESMERDMKLLYGSWPFDVADLDLSGNGAFDSDVHIWQGLDDYIVPAPLNQYVKRVQPNVKYTQLPEEGHLFSLKKGWSRRILTELVGIESGELATSPNVDVEKE